MNIAVFGATGRTGRHVLEQGLRRGHLMTAFTQDTEVTGPLTLRRSAGREPSQPPRYFRILSRAFFASGIIEPIYHRKVDRLEAPKDIVLIA
jgi:uncharacterized protein YbjT (DUF2867 family)